MSDNLTMLWAETTLTALLNLARPGTIGRREANDSVTIDVPGLPHYVYVELGAGDTTGVIEAYNGHAPMKEGTPVRVIKVEGIWIIVEVDHSSPRLTAEMFNVAYHVHKRDNGLPQSVHDLDGMPSSLAGAAGKTLLVAGDESRYYLGDAPAGEPGTPGADGASAYEVAVANGFVGDEAAWLASLVGPEGPTGPTGAPGADGDAADIAAETSGAAADDTITDTDIFGRVKGGSWVRTTFGVIKSTLKTYFDTLYPAIANVVLVTTDQTVAGIKNFTSDLLVAVIRRGVETGSLTLMGGTSATQGPYIQLIGKDAGGTDDGSINLVVTTESSANGLFTIWTYNGTSYTQVAQFDSTNRNLTLSNNAAFVGDILRALDASGVSIADDAGTVGLQVLDGANVRIPLTLIISGGTQDYHIYNGITDDLIFESATAAKGVNVKFATHDQDGTDPVVFTIYSHGGPLSGNDRKRLIFGYEPSLTAYRFFVETNGTYAGNIPMIFYTEGFDNQFVVGANGNNGMGVLTPRGKLDIYDSTTGWLKTTKTGVAGTEIDVIAAADSQRILRGYNVRMFARGSSGTIVRGDIGDDSAWADANTPGAGSVSWGFGFDSGSGLYKITLKLYSTGRLTVQRTQGSETWSVSLDLEYQ